MLPSSVVIVSPALAEANNGNWQTARRWSALLGGTHVVRITDHWPDAQASQDDVMVALHARRSADAIAAWADARGSRRLAVVLTGTDIYQADLDADAVALRSMDLAAHLVVLQDQAPRAVPARWRDKVRVIYQATEARPAVGKPRDRLQVAIVGHLRAVKSPETVFDVARRLAGRADIGFVHAGDADAHWATLAREAAAANPAYRWVGPLPHDEARTVIQQAHLLLHPSAAEGGAHVVMEAVRSGTPVLASRVDGNVGMLGEGYGGYFPHGDAAAAAELLLRCRDGLGNGPGDGLLDTLRAQCERRAPLFDPATEQRALLHLVQDLLEAP